MVEMVESEKGNGGGWIAVGLTLLKSYAQCWGNENMGFFFFFFEEEKFSTCFVLFFYLLPTLNIFLSAPGNLLSASPHFFFLFFPVRNVFIVKSFKVSNKYNFF